MATVVIGGHTRNIGKTSVVCALIAAMPERRWTAIKITQFGHGVYAADGELSGGEIADLPRGVFEEHDAAAGTDSSRYLAAGAAHSFWVRARQGQLADAMPRVRALIERAENAIVESNSILGFLRPDLYASVLDPEVADVKASALRYLERADAILLSGEGACQPGWAGVSMESIEKIPTFRIGPPSYCSSEFVSFVAHRLDDLAAQSASSVSAYI